MWQLVRKIRALEFFASGKSRGVGKRRFQDQGALPEKTPAAPRWRNAVIMDAGAPETTQLTTMLGGGSTAEQSLDRHTMALAQCVLMFLLLFFHAMSVAAAQVRVSLCVCERERERETPNFLMYYSFPLPLPHSLRCGHKRAMLCARHILGMHHA